jgi:DNA-binding transcriptional ArsR family regulator/uncharacterized protein YndB with AHSA1/START domain
MDGRPDDAIEALDDLVFKALADPTRRHLLDRLQDRGGRTLTELESELAMTRFGVMKHLKVLEDAGLVIARKSGREKLHFLNPVPIRLIHDRWIDKYTERHASALADLKHELEGLAMSTETTNEATGTAVTTQVYSVFIKATPEAVWTAITDPEWALRYGYKAPQRYDLKPGGEYWVGPSAEMKEFGAPDTIIVGEVLESDPPNRLVQTWHALFDQGIAAEAVTRLTWEIVPVQWGPTPSGVTKLTVTHELDGAPATAAVVAGGTAMGGGWLYIISDLKTLLETGAPLG